MDNLARALQPASGGGGIVASPHTKDDDRSMDDA